MRKETKIETKLIDNLIEKDKIMLSNQMASTSSDPKMYSATYVENYLDSVENLPNDVQRYLTRIREIDLQCKGKCLADAFKGMSLCFSIYLYEFLIAIPFQLQFICVTLTITMISGRIVRQPNWNRRIRQFHRNGPVTWHAFNRI